MQPPAQPDSRVSFSAKLFHTRLLETQAYGLASLAQPLLGRVGHAARTKLCVPASGARPDRFDSIEE